MRQIGFKNFRKFADFPMIDLAPITMFVGENNSGKSTVVKGILTLSEFLSGRTRRLLDLDSLLENDNEEDIISHIKKILKSQKFYFHSRYFAHIGTFKRAFYNRAKEDSITFKATTGVTTIELDVTGNKNDEDAVFGIIQRVGIFIHLYNISMDFNLLEDVVNIEFHHSHDKNEFERHGEKGKSLQKYFSSFERNYKFSMPISNTYRLGIGYDFVNELIESVQICMSATIFPDSSNSNKRYLRGRDIHPLNVSDDEMKFLLMFHDCFGKDEHPHYEFKFPEQRYLGARMLDIEYIYAHSVTQTVIYSAKDTNDYLSRTIHEFASVQGDQRKREFIIKWMKEFSIGKNFSIKSVGGEAHIVYITNMDDEKVNLADKGMGSIQLMVLLFRLAITLRPDLRRQWIPMNKIIIIEEPEQNLHPSLQSKLADLFYKMHKDYGFRFIIETHSEYLIRRSQLIVGEKYPTQESLKDNPFKVYYFPSEGEPYDMGYRTTGSFSEPFGPGFYDEAAKMDMEIIKREMNNPIKRRR